MKLEWEGTVDCDLENALIEVKHLSHQYKPGELILDDISFSIHSGEKIALVGDNGAGKSTLFQLLVGLLPMQGGEIFALSELMSDESDFVKMREFAGLVFQDPDDQLFCPSVLEDVMFGPLNQGYSVKQAAQKSQEMLERLELSHLSQRMAADLSGGEKRLVALAAVLVMQPKVLLLDEPTNALDSHSKKRLISVLESLDQAMLIISHEEAFLSQLTTRSLLLKNAKLTADESVINTPLNSRTV